MSETNITRLTYKSNVIRPKENIDINTMLVGSFKILYPETYRSSRQKVDKVQQTLCLDQMNLTITYRTPYLMAEEPQSSQQHMDISRTYCLTDLNTSFNKS